ncbi:MAG: competence/damage-inducible protein A [Clostridium sp.]|nr:competence/damage-inducible protein A [Clostridium sp.]
MKAEIIAIGSEILLGDIVNTNAQYLSKELAQVGIDVYHQQVVGDNEERLLRAYDEAYKRSELIITTGGLGPTQDDITKESAAKYFNKSLKLDENSLKSIEKYFNKQGRELKGNNIKQAYFPEGSIIMQNSCGTANGVIIEEENKKMIILPGPPKEMESMFKNEVMPYLEKLTNCVIKSKMLRIFGIGESFMAEELAYLIDNGKNPTVAPYAKGVDVSLRITAKGKSEEECLNLIKPIEMEVRKTLKQKVYAEGEVTLEHKVAEMLSKSNLTISTAESCTGGMIADKLISYPGISNVFIEGAVTYSNEAKIRRLGVKKETLDLYGAVSKETAREMAEGICKESGSDISIVTTGIAGPGGATKEKPVGLVYIGLCFKGETIVEKFTFQGERDKVRERATMNALNLLRIKMIEKGYCKE